MNEQTRAVLDAAIRVEPVVAWRWTVVGSGVPTETGETAETPPEVPTFADTGLREAETAADVVRWMADHVLWDDIDTSSPVVLQVEPAENKDGV